MNMVMITGNHQAFMLNQQFNDLVQIITAIPGNISGTDDRIYLSLTEYRQSLTKRIRVCMNITDQTYVHCHPCGNRAKPYFTRAGKLAPARSPCPSRGRQAGHSTFPHNYCLQYVA